MTAPIAFVDCETTGVHPGRRPWEIAIVRREPDGHETIALIHISDVDLSQADPFGLRVGRFYERHWNYARDSGEPSHHLIDVEALAVGYLAGLLEAARAEIDQSCTEPALTLPWRSDDLSRACGVEPPSEQDRHTALGDALWAKRLYDAITGGHDA